ncbi:MAG: SPOR domain-containing protein [Paludibacteraceae bacterium]|nr:SPOR domain-containing protein [Paludibacteraceae bacterium]
MKSFFSIFILFLLVLPLSAQEETEVKPANIFETLAIPDSVTGGVAVITQDPRIEALMIDRPSGTTVSGGYRVQVFSSNTQRTAKTQAYKIEKELREAFPEHMVYVSYAAPFWKVRVGDFRTSADAQALRTDIVSTFPNLRSETYIVRDHVNL